jgi:hypothetical protein
MTKTPPTNINRQVDEGVAWLRTESEKHIGIRKQSAEFAQPTVKSENYPNIKSG